MGNIVTKTAVCTMCGVTFEPGLVLVQDYDLCPECKKTYGGMAAVFCNKCNVVVARIKPGLSAQGYFVKPGDVLHVTECPTCKPGVTMSTPIEFQ